MYFKYLKEIQILKVVASKQKSVHLNKILIIILHQKVVFKIVSNKGRSCNSNTLFTFWCIVQTGPELIINYDWCLDREYITGIP